MYRLVLLTAALALACTPTARPQPASSDDAGEYFLGYVGQTGIEHCPNGSDFEWLDARSTLGFIPTGGVSLKFLEGKVVLARGEAGKRPAASTQIEPKECPPMQMRSDWTNSPQGIRVDRGNHPKIEFFTVTKVEPLEELVVERDGDELQVRFTNPLPFALAGVGFVAHYEGCYGKPGSTQRRGDGAPLGVGESVEVRFPMLDEVEARVHLVYSIELVVETAPDSPVLHVDLDAPVSAFGLDLECPDR